MTLWLKCLGRLENELSAQQFNTWIRPLQVTHDDHGICLFAPNRYVKDSVEKFFLSRIEEIAGQISETSVAVTVQIGSHIGEQVNHQGVFTAHGHSPDGQTEKSSVLNGEQYGAGGLNPAFSFENHVEGKSNQMARAAALQVGENPGDAYNPLFLYGGVGLGKTHLMHAAGNEILARDKNAKVAYVHSERFVADMVKALQHNAINEFKRYYRSLDALLIDDIQFFAGKNHSQEEFFHTFNNLLDGQRQVIITSDRFPKELSGVQERLTSRFGSGLTVSIEKPELETRVAILNKKARSMKTQLPEDLAFFIAKHVHSNVRDLEGALHRMVASARFSKRSLDIELARDVLRDLLVFHKRQTSIQNIQKTVADYYKIRVSDLHSKRRNRQITRPRQLAMYLTKEMTDMSLPEIGDGFGGRDHTTVIHACRKIEELLQHDEDMKLDYSNLRELLSS